MDYKNMNVGARPLSLKDYLLDDMSSCSSNGFGSFPRRQCCTTVRFLLDIELKNQEHQQYSYFKKNPPALLKSPSKSALSAFQHVITAIKRLPFAAGRSSETEKPKNSMLARSISKKINKKSSTFWRRKPNEKEIGRMKSFDELLKEDPVSSDRSKISPNDAYGNCRPESDIVTAAREACSSGDLKFTEEGQNGVVEVPLKDNKASNGETMGVPQSNVRGASTTISDGSEVSTTNSKEKLWSTEEKEQLSPVSVMDCPFDDEDDEVSSPYRHRVAHVAENKKKIQRFESLAELEPLNLTERFALQPESDNESLEWPQQCPYESKIGKFTSEIEEKEVAEENNHKALELLHLFKHKHPSNAPKTTTEKLVSDFFREQVTNARGKQGVSSFDKELFEQVEVWINGQNPHEPFLGWEVKANRQSYINDMEKDGTWKTLDQENMEVALELEIDIFSTLLNEMLGAI
ncbi:uncharacterized protein [Primulina eburnea]|uniref:uncharacterized protein isoform X2 n=1 Tax=Primulina eburnea TaxID=1245227 RepID=UPI003C6C66E0